MNNLRFGYNYILYEYFRTDNCLKKMDKHHSILTYHHNQQEYKIIIKNNSGPSNVMFVEDDEENDITQEFEKYYGPGHDFHNSEITPMFFGTNKIKVIYMCGLTKSFYDNEVIRI